MFGFGHHGHHGQDQPPQHHGGGGGGAHQPTFKIFCRADEGYCVAVREGNVVLAPTNPRDEHQHWYKDMRFSAKIKDEEGNPAFALVNKATGLAIKHSLGQGHPVKLAPFNPEYPDESVLWTESGDVGKSFRCIRMLNNIRLNFDAFHGDKDHGGVHDGTTIVLWEWAKGDNQCWKILPWGDEAYAGGSANAPRGGNEPTVRIFCKADEGFSVTVRGGSVCLAPTNPRDEYQHWIKDMRHSHQALPRRRPPCEAGAVQPRIPGRVGAVDGEPRRRARLPLHPHGEQHLPQLRRPPRRQGPRRRPRRHHRRALEVVRGRQPALEDRPLVNAVCWSCIGRRRDLWSWESLRPWPAALCLCC
uniref:Expressed protein n=1 Tax=Oryza sativa subsp. japonica TaxID=39947 RepID=Q10M13_ORYSJ|nr:expressed protein [Oryza sativa Japonica Group]